MDRRSRLLVTHIDALRQAVRKARAHAPFHIDAWVVLPEHMHCVWTLPKGDAHFSRRWTEIKMAFSKAIPADEPRSTVMMARGDRAVWQRRFWEHTIRNERDYAAHLDYVHFNPVKHGLVDHPGDWPYSSLQSCMARAVYPKEWSAPATNEPTETGERR